MLSWKRLILNSETSKVPDTTDIIQLIFLMDSEMIIDGINEGVKCLVKLALNCLVAYITAEILNVAPDLSMERFKCKTCEPLTSCASSLEKNHVDNPFS